MVCRLTLSLPSLPLLSPPLPHCGCSLAFHWTLKHASWRPFKLCLLCSSLESPGSWVSNQQCTVAVVGPFPVNSIYLQHPHPEAPPPNSPSPFPPLFQAGANISGDLRHPSTAIPQGTLLACAVTFIIYFMICESQASIPHQKTTALMASGPQCGDCLVL